MADVRPLIKAPNMKMGEFNKNLMEACLSAPITSIEAAVVQGEPVIVLLSDIVEADQEMVEEAKQDGEDIKVGELVPASDPLIVQVIKLSAADDLASKCAASFGIVQKRAPDVAEVRIIKGPAIEWVPDRNDLDQDGKAKPNARWVMIQTEAVYAVVLSYAGDAEAE